jgi:putative ABC transport system permease protein
MMRIERWPSIVALRIRTLFRRADVERELEEELRDHIERQVEANVARGMDEAAARRAALLSFGGTERVREETRDRIRSPMLAELLQDARYAWRTARRTPALTTVAVVTVGAAVGLATSTFSAVNGVLLRALPYAHADRLALVWSSKREGGGLDPVSFTNATDWRRDVTSFKSLAVFSCTPRPILAARGEPARTTRMEVSSDFFSVLETKPLMGRLFQARDLEPGAPPAIVITYSLWRERFGGVASAVSSTVLVDGVPTTVIGILPPDFAALPAMLACHPEIYAPLLSRYDNTQRSWSFLRTIVRLTPSATTRTAQSQLDVEGERLAADFPDANRGYVARIVSMRDFVTAPLRGGLLLIQAGAILVLLIACANVAALLITRASTRQREVAIRVALGASRTRLARQLATECTLLGLISAAIGVMLSWAGSAAIARVAGDALPDPRGLSVDVRVLGFCIAASLIATLVFASAAITTSIGGRWRPLAALRDGGHPASVGGSDLRRAMVALQLAMATLVLVCAGLLTRSYSRLLDVHPGFDTKGVVAARVTLPDALYPRGERQVHFFRQVLGRLSRQPGVIAAGAVSILPESPNFDRTNAKVVGRSYAPGQVPTPDVYRVTPAYFDAMRIPIDEGRSFSASDDDQHPLVAIINETMARVLFPGEDAIGKRIWTGAGQAERSIVGIAGDSRQYGLDQAQTMQLYVPHADNSGGDLTLVVRSTDDARAVAEAIRTAVREVDPGVPVDEVLTMNQVLVQSSGRRRLLAQLSLGLAAGAIGLAVIGLYGVIAFGVAKRTPEIGLRMALGATTREIVGRVIGDVGRLVAVGLGLGVPLSMWVARLLSPLLFGIAPWDPFTFATASVALIVVTVLAAFVPARRAANVNPTIALRGG